MTVFVSLYHLEPAILPKDITEIRNNFFFTLTLKLVVTGRVEWAVGGGGRSGGQGVGNDKALEQNLETVAFFFQLKKL